MYYERKEAGTKLVAFSHKVLVFEEKTDHDVCVAIQGEIPPGMNLPRGKIFTKGMKILDNFNPVGCSFETLESIHCLLDENIKSPLIN